MIINSSKHTSLFFLIYFQQMSWDQFSLAPSNKNINESNIPNKFAINNIISYLSDEFEAFSSFFSSLFSSSSLESLAFDDDSKSLFV